jgi:hypothetical protein
MDDLIRDYHNDLNPKAFSSCDARTPGSDSCMECFKCQYFDGNEISYDCVEKRKLYVLRYFPVHCMENYHGSTNIPCDVIDSWFEYGHVDILSIGGGPGSDVCGALEYLEEEAKRRQVELSVDIVRLDIEDQWDEVFDDVMERFFPWVSHRTVHLDVNGGINLISNGGFDLVTASYLTSELSAEACLNLADEVDTVLIDGGVLMINDRPEDVVERNIRSMLDRIKLSYDEYFLNSWAGYSYPNDVASVVGPKFRMNSKMFVGVKR